MLLSLMSVLLVCMHIKLITSPGGYNFPSAAHVDINKSEEISRLQSLREEKMLLLAIGTVALIVRLPLRVHD